MFTLVCLLTATSNPEDLYNSVSDTLVAFGIADGGSGLHLWWQTSPMLGLLQTQQL